MLIVTKRAMLLSIAFLLVLAGYETNSAPLSTTVSAIECYQQHSNNSTLITLIISAEGAVDVTTSMKNRIRYQSRGGTVSVQFPESQFPIQVRDLNQAVQVLVNDKCQVEASRSEDK